jgi:radical SAM protein with 4Fe4S-binding SPASM domain
VRRRAPEAPFALGVADNIGYYTPEEAFIRGRADGGPAFGGCSAGLTSLGIDSVGNVRGCESMYDERVIEGNLRERTLGDIWEDPDAFAYNRRFTASLLTGKCASCPYGEECAGGCRSYNYFAGGGRLYENPLCVR